MLSLRSQVNPIPEVSSNSASEGKLGKRQPESRSKWKDYQQVHILVYYTATLMKRFNVVK
jgi:hypothetical protein